MGARARRLVLLAVLTGAAPLACADIIGLGDVPTPLGGDADGAVADAGSDTAVPPFDASGCDACAALVPAGWTPVIYSTTTTTCPDGFGSLGLRATNPVIDAGACTCTATAQSPPSCVTGTASLTVGCSGSPDLLSITDGGCNTFATINMTSTASVPLMTATGGSCKPAALPDTSKLSSSTAATCVPVSCPDSLCTMAAAPAGFVACIEHDGDLTCPSTTLFGTKVSLADTFTLDCSAACTSCTASATCNGGVLYLWNNCSAMVPANAVLADGTCRATNPTPVTGATYAANMFGITYTADGPKTASAVAMNPKTLCCH